MPPTGSQCCPDAQGDCPCTFPRLPGKDTTSTSNLPPQWIHSCTDFNLHLPWPSLFHFCAQKHKTRSKQETFSMSANNQSNNNTNNTGGNRTPQQQQHYQQWFQHWVEYQYRMAFATNTYQNATRSMPPPPGATPVQPPTGGTLIFYSTPNMTSF